MMRFFHLFSAAALLSATTLWGQTWTVGNTTLTESDLVTGVNLPWELLWGPDDHLWCTTRPGEVLRIDPSNGSYTTVLSLNVMNNGNGEPGLLGMAMHPDWANTPKVYLVYCTGSGWNGEERLSAFDWNGSALVNEEVLLTLGPNGLIYASEHGQNSDDEFNIVTAGGNYGWPDVQGFCNTLGEQAFCAANDVTEPLMAWTPCVAVNGIEYYDHPAIPEWQNSVLMAVLGGLSGAYERLSVLHLNADGTSIESEEQFFSSFNQRVRDVAVNPYTGAVYVAFNGVSYPGSGPNIIKEFKNEAFASNVEWVPEGPQLTAFPNPNSGMLTVQCPSTSSTSRWEVVSFSGKRVAAGTVQKTEWTINTSAWSAGPYFLRITDGNRTQTLTFTVQ